MWMGLVLVLVGCGGGGRGTAAEEADEGSAGGEQTAELSPEALVASYERNARGLQREWSPDGPMAPLAGEALAALREWGAARGAPETYLTLEIVSPEWRVLRHDVTGVVTGRRVTGITIARFPDGRCLEYAGNFEQEAIGDTFSDRLRALGVGGGVGVPCETAELVSSRPGVAR